MLAEGSRRGELAKPVADHLLSHEDWEVLLAIVDGEGVADELRSDDASATPGLDWLFLTGGVQGVYFLCNAGVNVRSFFGRATHRESKKLGLLATAGETTRLPTRDNEFIRVFILAASFDT